MNGILKIGGKGMKAADDTVNNEAESGREVSHFIVVISSRDIIRKVNFKARDVI